ncbi:MAG: TonB-dependent receptor plug domain-containing protein [Bacteroidetes bacterium]|nr:TonB-dependent receptor plug domain-containing protein [Bacteroidota bacterium]
MKKFSALLLLILFSRVTFAQQKPDSLPVIPWPDTIKQSQFNEGIIGDPLQLILGKDPGAEVFKAGSDPNASSSFMLRGAFGIYSETNPLYVIDGIAGGSLFMVPPEEIESVKILKNLSETSFYGSEGSGGVLLITTKSGSKHRRLSVSFNTALSLQKTPGLDGLFTAQEMRDKALSHPEIHFVDGGATTDWQDELFRTKVSQTYQLAVGGTLKNTTYRLSFSHSVQPGSVLGSDRNMTGGSVNLAQTALKNRLQVNGFVSWYQVKSNSIIYPTGRYGNNLLYQVFSQNPTDPVYNADGSFYEPRRVYLDYNPAALADMTTNEATAKQLSAVLNAAWEIWKGLGIKITGSYTDSKSTSLYILPAAVQYYDRTFKSEGSFPYTRTNLLAGITYNRCLKEKHFLDLFAGYIYRSSTQEREINSSYDTISLASSPETIRYKDYGLRATLNYHFSHKYHLGMVINQEHYQSDVTHAPTSPTLGWGEWVFYPGITASWEIHRERFMKNLRPVSRLILKAGYGIAGARPKAEYLSESNEGYNDKKLTTEKTAEITAGLDAGFFRNRLMLGFEYYHRNTNNALFRENIPVPPYLAQYSYRNGMKVVNSGIELSISARVLDGRNLAWNSILGLSSNKNKVVSIDGNASMHSGYIDAFQLFSGTPYVLITTSGHPVLAYSLPVFSGYYQGKPVYVKADGGYTNNVNLAKLAVSDQVFPDYMLSWTNSFTLFKTFDLSFMFRYVAGHRIFNATRMYLADPSNYLEINTLQEAEQNYNEGVLITPMSDMYLENASYLRLENLAAGYTLIPKNMKWKGRLRVYLAINNLFTITGYSGIDPSFNYNSPGVDSFNTFPKNHSYTLGINLEI